MSSVGILNVRLERIQEERHKRHRSRGIDDRMRMLRSAYWPPLGPATPGIQATKFDRNSSCCPWISNDDCVVLSAVEYSYFMERVAFITRIILICATSREAAL